MPDSLFLCCVPTSTYLHASLLKVKKMWHVTQQQHVSCPAVSSSLDKMTKWNNSSQTCHLPTFHEDVLAMFCSFFLLRACCIICVPPAHAGFWTNIISKMLIKPKKASLNPRLLCVIQEVWDVSKIDKLKYQCVFTWSVFVKQNYSQGVKSKE